MLADVSSDDDINKFLRGANPKELLQLIQKLQYYLVNIMFLELNLFVNV